MSWSRRGFVTAVGAGAAALGGVYAMTRPRDSLKIKFHGLFVVTKGPDDNSYDILMPFAKTGPGTYRHQDSVPARSHQAWLYNPPNAGESIAESLDHHAIALKGDGDLPAPNFRSMFDLEEATKHIHGNVELRDYTDAALSNYIARITLYGGASLTPMHEGHGRIKTWIIPGTSIRIVNPDNELVWDTGLETIEVKVGTKVIKLESSKHGNVQFGHLPSAPDKWGTMPNDDDEPETGWVDQDFKWLYKSVIPKNSHAEAKPWKAKLNHRNLPAPTIEEIGSESGIGTPTCFGGCFGCT